MTVFHPGLLLFTWLCIVSGLQFLDFSALMTAVALFGVLAFLSAPQRTRRLVKRIRFILIAIIVLFAGFTPGEAVFIDWPTLSPSREGVVLALEHAGRVLGVLFGVAMLLEWLSPPGLVAALYALLRPFERVGFPAAKVAVRTLLVLKLVEAEKPPRWQTWLSDDSNDLHDVIAVSRQRFGPYDYALMSALVIALVLLLRSLG